jgi:hypothetical protein
VNWRWIFVKECCQLVVVVFEVIVGGVKLKHLPDEVGGQVVAGDAR